MALIKSDKRGFTLVELLVVLAVLALLTAIMVPVFGKARENARRTSCIAHLHQLGIALKLYRTDYDRADAPWLSALVPDYVSNAEVLLCPSDKGEGKVWRWLGTTEADYAELDDYAYSGNNLPCSYMYEFAAAPCSWDTRIADGSSHTWHTYDGVNTPAPTACTGTPNHASYSQTAGQPKAAYPLSYWSWRDVKMVQMKGMYCPACNSLEHGETQIKQDSDDTVYLPTNASHAAGKIYGYGDDVPIVRCGHHARRGDENSSHFYTNLTYGGRAYFSKAKWEEER